jgi:hypothetical protein
MKRLLLLGALGGALIAAAPAEAAKLHPCGRNGKSQVSKVYHRGISCGDASILISSVEAHKAQCAPYRQQTIAPFRECVVTPALSVGNRNFFCRSSYETSGSNKRFWRTLCKSFVGDVVRWRRDGSYVG